MDALPTRLDLDALSVELLQVPRPLRAYDTLEMAHWLASGIPDWAQHGSTARALLEIVTLTGRTPRHLMVNLLPAGVVIPIHTDREDAGPQGERWHLPITTNPGCFWWDDSLDGELHQAAGYWWGPCPNRLPHRVGNRGATDRLHLIVDLA